MRRASRLHRFLNGDRRFTSIANAIAAMLDR
jgi:hypothetical protein